MITLTVGKVKAQMEYAELASRAINSFHEQHREWSALEGIRQNKIYYASSKALRMIADGKPELVEEAPWADAVEIRFGEPHLRIAGVRYGKRTSNMNFGITYEPPFYMVKRKTVWMPIAIPQCVKVDPHGWDLDVNWGGDASFSFGGSHELWEWVLIEPYLLESIIMLNGILEPGDENPFTGLLTSSRSEIRTLANQVKKRLGETNESLRRSLTAMIIARLEHGGNGEKA